MPGNVRRLALDINPLVRLYLLFLAGVAVLFDYDWCTYSQYLQMTLIPGFLFGIMANIVLPKVPVWRLLPVSRTEMDRARWWLGIGGPALALGLVMTVAWALSGAMGHPGPAPGSIALVVAAQIGVAVALIFIQWFVFPLAAPVTGRWSVLLLIPLLLVIFRVILLPRDHQTSQGLMLGFAYGGPTGAALLYFCTGHWPAPMVAGLWAAAAAERLEPKTTPQAPGLRGWTALLVSSSPILLMTWAGVLVFPAVIQLVVPDADVTVFGWIVTLLAAQISVMPLAGAMRVLRALPLSGGRLTLYLVLVLTAVATIALLAFQLGIYFVGHQPRNPVSQLPLLCLPLLYFPSTLRFGFRFAQFGYAASLIIMLPLQLLPLMPLEVAALATGALCTAGAAWTWWEITRGTSAYRLQPLVAPRWRSL